MTDRICFRIIDACVRVMDTSRISVSAAALLVVVALVLGWPQGAIAVVWLVGVPVAGSAAVLLIVAAAWPELARRWNDCDR